MALDRHLKPPRGRFGPINHSATELPEHPSRFQCGGKFFLHVEDHEPRKSDDRIETLRNSDDRPSVSHAAHQLNVNVCLCVRRDWWTFIDALALAGRFWQPDFGEKLSVFSTGFADHCPKAQPLPFHP